MPRIHWGGEDVVTLDTTLASLPTVLPEFDRCSFGGNRFRDVIVRRAKGDRRTVPVGTVSKKYVLVQHADAARAVTTEVARAGIDPADVPVHVLMSEYGARMALRATLPQQYGFTPRDGHTMALTFECFNSVDRSVALWAAVGWFRIVCTNGLIVGATSANERHRHSPPLDMDEIGEVLADGIKSAQRDATSFERWTSTRIPRARLVDWVNGPVADAWGPLAAARVHTIATTGFDGVRAKPFTKRPPHQWAMDRTIEVPGTRLPSDDGFAIAQVLAWVASHRRDVAERLAWRGSIRLLISHLIPDAA